MGEEIERQYTLTEYVFRDIRVIKNSKHFYVRKVYDALDGIKDPLSRVLEYQKICKKNDTSPDAERWSIALESYKKYPCFISDDYSVEKSILCYKKDGNRIRISADTLTGPSEMIKPVNNLFSNNKPLKEALDEFCMVAYTIGNVCPVMNNKGGSPGSDTCWYKLGSYHKTDKHCRFKNTIDSNWDNNLNNRSADNMFAVFPHNLSGREIVNRLMLNDYYDDNYNLIITKSPQEYAALGVDEYINFLRLVTTLIIKRGIRIYNALPDDMKKSE